MFAADSQKIDPNTARAYQAYLLTFEWPSYASSEQVPYKKVTNPSALPRYLSNDNNRGSQGADIAPLSVPFDSFKNKIAPNAPVLISQKWILIFNKRGDTISKTFQSEQNTNGYPELTGSISVRFAHFLESDIKYQHYLFTPPPGAANPANNEMAAQNSEQNGTAATNEQPLGPMPTQVLNLEEENKTASKKLNYIDHPIIGTLLYFEPMDLNDAIQQRNLDRLKSQN